MAKQNVDLEDRITKFYQYLEHRLKLENEIDEKLILNEKLIPIEIKYKKEKEKIITHPI
jgi:hypothetical protein